MSRRPRHDERHFCTRADDYRAHPVHVELPGAAHALRRGVGRGSDGGAGGRGIDDGGVDAGIELVREYSRHVEAVTAATPDGRARAVEKSDKNRWRVTTGGAPTVTVRYCVYGREMTVRTNWIDAGFALINGAPTFMTLPDGVARPHEIVLNLPPGWRRSLTGLPEMPGGENRYRAPNYDVLVDSPFLLGNPTVHEFTVDGKKHVLVNEGEGGVFDGARAAKDSGSNPGTAPLLGPASLREVSLHEHPGRQRTGRGSRAHELHRAHHQPLHDQDAARVPGLARARQPRTVSCVERQTAAPRGARALRLRERGAHEEPVDGRRPDRLLR